MEQQVDSEHDDTTIWPIIFSHQLLPPTITVTHFLSAALPHTAFFHLTTNTGQIGCFHNSSSSFEYKGRYFFSEECFIPVGKYLSALNPAKLFHMIFPPPRSSSLHLPIPFDPPRRQLLFYLNKRNATRLTGEM